MNPETRTCQNCKNEFTIEPEDFLFYEKIKAPPPTFCPECRMARRMAFRNERSLYKRKDAFGNDVLSIYAPENPFVVYDQKYWWSDKWDPLDYGRAYDFSRPFFEQWKELRDKFPLLSVSNANAVNSDYCNVADSSKDCYLISAAEWNERVLYSNRIAKMKDSMDLYTVINGELCYDDIFCDKSYRLFFSNDCDNCVDSAFLYDCKGCQHCLGCVNLRNKSHCIFNEQYSKEEYERRLKEIDLGSFKTILEQKEKFSEDMMRALHRYASVWRSINVSGDHVEESKNCKFCFDIAAAAGGGGAEDCKFIEWGGFGLKDSYDGGPGVGAQASLIYEAFDTGIDNGSRLIGTSVVYGSHNVSYSFNYHGSSNLFGCLGLRNKQYCILNKQYMKEEYGELVPKIIEHMNSNPYIDKKGRTYRYGEFFPIELSPFAYNETVAQEYFPLTKEEALEKGYSWKDPESRPYAITITHDKLPDHIKDVKDDILNQTIGCEHKGNCNEGCTAAFKIIPQELEFYRKMNLPLPRLCYNCRHAARLKQRNPLKLWHRRCQCAGTKSQNGVYQNQTAHFHKHEPCPNEFETSYAPERPEIIYCESCYQNEVA